MAYSKGVSAGYLRRALKSAVRSGRRQGRAAMSYSKKKSTWMWVAGAAAAAYLFVPGMKDKVHNLFKKG